MVTRETFETAPEGIQGGTAAEAGGPSIALVSEPGCDGVFRYVEGLVDHLLRRGLRVHLAWSDKRPCDDLQRLVRRVEDSGGQTLNLSVSNAPSARDVPAFLALRAWIKRLQPDIVHAHSSKAGALARALQVTGVRTPIFYTPHAYYGLRPRGALKAGFFNAVERALKSFGNTINTSGSEADFALHRLRVKPTQQRTIPNGADTDRFRPATPDERIAARERLGLPEDAIVLGSVCRVSDQKDPLTLYKAFSRVARGRKDLVLYHLGGRGKPDLERKLAAVVKSHNLEDQIVRETYRGDMETVYHAIDALALTSRYEGLSLVLLEALAADLPLVLSDAPGNSDLQADGLNRAWWARPGRVPEFADCIDDCMRTSRAGCNHRRIAIERYSQSVCYDTLIECYGKALEGVPSAARLLPFPRKVTPTPAA